MLRAEEILERFELVILKPRKIIIKKVEKACPTKEAHCFGQLQSLL